MKQGLIPCNSVIQKLLGTPFAKNFTALNCIQMVHYRTHKSPSLVNFVSEMNPVQPHLNQTWIIFKILFNIIKKSSGSVLEN
jgi:hypothetical protein